VKFEKFIEQLEFIWFRLDLVFGLAILFEGFRGAAIIVSISGCDYYINNIFYSLIQELCRYVPNLFCIFSCPR
jgi:hypothetical protein